MKKVLQFFLVVFVAALVGAMPTAAKEKESFTCPPDPIFFEPTGIPQMEFQRHGDSMSVLLIDRSRTCENLRGGNDEDYNSFLVVASQTDGFDAFAGALVKYMQDENLGFTRQGLEKAFHESGILEMMGNARLGIPVAEGLPQPIDRYVTYAPALEVIVQTWHPVCEFCDTGNRPSPISCGGWNLCVRDCYEGSAGCTKSIVPAQ